MISRSQVQLWWTLAHRFVLLTSGSRLHSADLSKSNESELFCNSSVIQRSHLTKLITGQRYSYSTNQERAEEDKGDKVEVGKITAALFPMGPRSLVTGSVTQTRQHDLVPGLASRTPNTHKNMEENREALIEETSWAGSILQVHSSASTLNIVKWLFTYTWMHI